MPNVGAETAQAERVFRLQSAVNELHARDADHEKRLRRLERYQAVVDSRELRDILEWGDAHCGGCARLESFIEELEKKHVERPEEEASA